ncbi:unnamed protein product [Caenorhabditis auriculariae]|uniref:ATPase inhibitor, mitochondrial n=1 Tax=Caenorhabditis auriculariae TaxID=2777116 RepID=A0A8S1H677_9PELO|nr:unnamed protein product [Caenorhabditis auriculariae]
MRENANEGRKRKRSHVYPKIMLRVVNQLPVVARTAVRALSGGPGEGSGRGGGSGGSIRDAGGAFGKMEAAREDEYFYKKQKEQLQKLRGHIQEEVDHHAQQLENHKKALERHQKRISEIEAEERSLGKE